MYVPAGTAGMAQVREEAEAAVTMHRVQPFRYTLSSCHAGTLVPPVPIPTPSASVRKPAPDSVMAEPAVMLASMVTAVTDGVSVSSHTKAHPVAPAVRLNAATSHSAGRPFTVTATPGSGSAVRNHSMGAGQ